MTTGKIYEASMDVYQDQASELFNFYANAAQKIMQQEDDCDRRIAELNQEAANIQGESGAAVRNYIIGGVVALLGIILGIAVHWAFLLLILAGIGVAVLGLTKGGSIKKRVEQVQQQIMQVQQERQRIFRGYKITKMGVVYVPVARKQPFNDKGVVVDYTGTTPRSTISLQVANNPDALVQTLNDLERLSTEAPLVENNEQTEAVETSDYSASIQDVTFYDYFGMMDRTLRTGAYFLSDVSTKEVTIPFVHPQSTMMNYLDSYATTEVGDAPVVNVYDLQSFDKELQDFNQINEFNIRFAEQHANFEGVLKHLIRNIGVAVQTVATMKVASNNKLIDSSNQLLFTILKNSYNHYSPLLEHEEIEKMRNTNFNYSETVENYRPFQMKASSRVRYDALTGNWVAEDGTVTTMPFGISQIQEEIVAPIVQNLLAESRLERMKIYNDIKNQKINYLNQWHQDTEDFYGRNRSSSDDLLNIMRSNMTKFIAAQETVKSMAGIKGNMRRQMELGQAASGELEDKKEGENSEAETLATFELQSQQFRKAQEDFDEYMERLKDDIDERARNFEYIEFYDASLRDSNAKELITASDTQDELDERRRPLANINPLYAKASILPPAPQVDDSVNEQLSLNVARYAANALEEIDGHDGMFVPPVAPMPPVAHEYPTTEPEPPMAPEPSVVPEPPVVPEYPATEPEPPVVPEPPVEPEPPIAPVDYTEPTLTVAPEPPVAPVPPVVPEPPVAPVPPVEPVTPTPPPLPPTGDGMTPPPVPPVPPTNITI